MKAAGGVPPRLWRAPMGCQAAMRMHAYQYESCPRPCPRHAEGKCRVRALCTSESAFIASSAHPGPGLGSGPARTQPSWPGA